MKPSTSKSVTDKLKILYSSHNTLPKLIEDEKIKAQSLEEYYVKLQILLSEDDEAGKAALRDKVVGEKKSVEIENIFKAIDTKEKIRGLLKKELPNKEYQIDNIVELLNEEKKMRKKKFDILRRNLPNKSESEIKNIAESISRIQADIGKVLLLGSAGIGKTTLMHYLSYKWGKGELWNDKFDYVFRVKLKELLNESWKDGYSGYFDINNLSQSKLNCFIHYCLGGSESTLSVKKIMDIQNKDKMLLLLDGYDEVAHLNIRDEFKKLIDKILEYKNVIMTSRPNAVIEEMSNRFERKVENTGWDSEGIEQYVNKNFEYDKELGVQLKSFLDTHSQIKEICEVPINTALICLVWSDKDIRDKFQKSSDEDFNISQLYQEVVIWLGKKYFQKFENERIVNITDGQILSTPELQFLQEIAFEALVNTGKLVTHQLIKAKLDDKNFKTLNIEKINKLGLLKAEETGESIINLNHQFIHLTFQEYLAACYLKNQLADNNTKYKAANFIGKHRNDPKYLMTLKFLAGIVNNDNNQELIEIFWEAVTCNVDGILELGIERKIILLMHLLAQSKINGKFDNRIPNLTQIQNLIDDIVLKDITIWEQHIIDSGYLSEKIIKTVNEKLRKSKTDFQELKASVGIITSLVNRHEWGSKTKVYTRLISLLKV
ncbi:N-acetylglucosamine kinase [Rickettsia felis]|nr:NACHT domain-containing protein [Rickettsia felis]KHO03484.1 N-acetylglucosamine kinase [Rickettsia felis]